MKLILFILLIQADLVFAYDTTWPVGDAAGSSELWAAANAYDGDTTTSWSSSLYSEAQHEEQVFYWLQNYDPQDVNYLRLAVRFDGTSALGFPVEFKISYDNGHGWIDVRAFTHFSRPTTQWVILPLDTTVNTDGIRITATVLGDDKVGNYVFQLAEVQAGYNDTLAGLEYSPNPYTAVSSSLNSFWLPDNAGDNNIGTSWSSNIHGSSGNTEWIAYWFGSQPINYVKIRPRFYSSLARCFPEDFSINYSDGYQWNQVTSYTAFPDPQRDDWIIVPLPETVTGDGIQIVATKLRTDKTGSNYYFQLAEVGAGYDPAFEHFKLMGNNSGITGRVTIGNVGSEPFNRPEQMGNFNFDARGVLFQPSSYPGDGNPPGFSHRNIYAPSIVNTGASSWNLYFGGWDGNDTGTMAKSCGKNFGDCIYKTTTADDFTTFGGHSVMIQGKNVDVLHPGNPPNYSSPSFDGYSDHVNNEIVVRTDPTHWYMAYTTGYAGHAPLYAGLGRTSYATSSDGTNWTPSIADTTLNQTGTYNVQMSGYGSWSTADVNGGNVIYQDPNSTWHLFFNDFTDSAFYWACRARMWPTVKGVHHATSNGGISSFTYDAQLPPYDINGNKLQVVMNDMKSFTYGGATYYLGAYQYSASNIWMSINTSLTSLDSLVIPFYSWGSGAPNSGYITDDFITSVGWVQDGSRMYGVLYGASGLDPCDSTIAFLTSERIYARWLQKRVVFKNSDVNWGDGYDGEHAFGPDSIFLYMAANDHLETGRFYVYDTDGERLLYRSPQVTMREGDIWTYDPALGASGFLKHSAEGSTRFVHATEFDPQFRFIGGHVSYKLPAGSTHVKAVIFDTRGKRLNELADDLQEAGTHELQIPTRKNGLSILDFRAGSFHKTLLMSGN